MKHSLMKLKDRIYNTITHFIGVRTKKYYYEDFIRVYPDGLVFDKFGKRRKTTNDDIKNFINHKKFYQFAAQFVKGKIVADAGCGAGYGCEVLKKAGAVCVYGSDISCPSIDFAKSHYGDYTEFTVQSLTDLKEYQDNIVDISISSEVLEHIKEYGVEQKAIDELKRITRDKGLIIIGTPNSEMLGDHGFPYDEINKLFNRNFSEYCIFENALVPYGEKKALWQKRVDEGMVGAIVSQNINLSETVIPKNVIPELKRGVAPGIFTLGSLQIDTSYLHNTHSWIVVAVNSKNQK